MSRFFNATYSLEKQLNFIELLEAKTMVLNTLILCDCMKNAAFLPPPFLRRTQCRSQQSRFGISFNPIESGTKTLQSAISHSRIEFTLKSCTRHCNLGSVVKIPSTSTQNSLLNDFHLQFGNMYSWPHNQPTSKFNSFNLFSVFAVVVAFFSLSFIGKSSSWSFWVAECRQVESDSQKTSKRENHMWKI